MKKLTAELFYNKSERRKRVSVDVDNYHHYGPFKILRIYFMLKLLFPNSVVSVEKSRRGVHIKAVGEEVASIPIEKRIDLRDSLGDDGERVRYDRAKLSWNLPFFVETLFDMKDYPDNVIYHVEKMNPIALPYYSRLPAKKRSEKKWRKLKTK